MRLWRWWALRRARDRGPQAMVGYLNARAAQAMRGGIEARRRADYLKDRTVR